MQEVLVLPASVLSYTDASVESIRVLLWLASDLSLVSKPAQLAKLADCDAATAKAAIEYWCEKGVLSREGAAVAVMSQSVEPKSIETPKKKLLKRADELPNYTSVELAELLEKRESVRALVDEAQQILGKIFNMSEVNILVGMLERSICAPLKNMPILWWSAASPLQRLWRRRSEPLRHCAALKDRSERCLA